MWRHFRNYTDPFTFYLQHILLTKYLDLYSVLCRNLLQRSSLYKLLTPGSLGSLSHFFLADHVNLSQSHPQISPQMFYTVGFESGLWLGHTRTDLSQSHTSVDCKLRVIVMLVGEPLPQSQFA